MKLEVTSNFKILGYYSDDKFGDFLKDTGDFFLRKPGHTAVNWEKWDWGQATNWTEPRGKQNPSLSKIKEWAWGATYLWEPVDGSLGRAIVNSGPHSNSIEFFRSLSMEKLRQNLQQLVDGNDALWRQLVEQTPRQLVEQIPPSNNDQVKMISILNEKTSKLDICMSRSVINALDSDIEMSKSISVLDRKVPNVEESETVVKNDVIAEKKSTPLDVRADSVDKSTSKVRWIIFGVHRF